MIKPCPFEDKSCTGAVCLSTLGVGQRGRVVDVDSGTAFSNRLLELGFVPGTLVEIRRRAPLMDPIELELRGVRICLRRTEVCRIAVELL